MPPISPMSWKGGSQKTPLSPGRCAETRWITDELCSRFAWVSITPARLARGARRVLQHRQRRGGRRARDGRAYGAAQLTDVEPAHLRRRVAEREPALEPRGERGVHERDAGARVRDDAVDTRIGAPWIRWIRRDRDGARIQTGEERRDVVETRRHQQHDAVDRRRRARGSRRRCHGRGREARER